MTRPVLEKGKLNLVEGWLKDDKITCSETLGDMVMTYNPKMALSIYLRAKANEKVVHAFLQLKQYDKIVAYAASVGYSPGTITRMVPFIVLYPFVSSYTPATPLATCLLLCHQAQSLSFSLLV